MAVNASDATLTGLATAHTGGTAGHPAPNAPTAGSFDLILQAAAGSALGNSGTPYTLTISAIDLTSCSRPFTVSTKVTFRVAVSRHVEPRRAGCRAGFRWPGCRGGGQSVAVSSAMAVRAEDSSAMVLLAV